jgi:hypothetical protein
MNTWRRSGMLAWPSGFLEAVPSGGSVCPELTRAATLGLLGGWPREVPMGALVFWLGVGLLLALVLLAARTVDRRDRHRGHDLRSSGEMSRPPDERREA